MDKLDAAIIGRDNNFNLLRIVAASAVLVSHAYPIALGSGAAEPLSKLLGMTLGTVAVLTFFMISGFFISQSLDRSNNIADFIAARVLRIYPGLFGVLLVTVLIIGPIFTKMDLQSYFSNLSTLLYLPHNLSLKFLQYDIPGVFLDNPYPAVVNGSLWSLYFEVTCYGLVLAVGILCGRSMCLTLALILYTVAYVALKLADQKTNVLKHSVILGNFHQLTLPFVVGMALYRFRRLLPLSVVWCALAVAAAGAAYRGPWFNEIFVLSWSYLVFYFGYFGFSPLKLYNHLGDYSYGMYIYAFPVEQTVAAIWRGVSPLGVIVLSFPATLVIAILSWHLLEGPFLKVRPRLAASLGRLVSRKWSRTAPSTSNNSR